MRLFRLLISCPDRPGIMSAVSSALADAGAIAVRSDQYSTDLEGGTFFLRVEFALLPDESLDAFTSTFRTTVARPFRMDWRLWDPARRKRLAILVSRHDHCMLDLLWRWQRDELEADVVLVASNHPDLASVVEAFGVPYHHVPVAPSKAEAEQRLLELLEGSCDLVVLARYMQIVSKEFLERVGVPVINIHHSFLPAFPGAEPYAQAHKRGVKLIGATAHYVTEELDAGPIIEQDVIRVSYRDDIETLRRRGADVERAVLARAVEWHCEDRVLRYGNTTVLF
jgi:formyltetrahydrofolate deformylase